MAPQGWRTCVRFHAILVCVAAGRPAARGRPTTGAALLGVAMAKVVLWRYAMAMQAERISKRQDEAFGSAQVDLELFAVALWRFVRSVELVKGRCVSGRAELVDQALAAFHSAVPGAKEVRDWQEHFDTYELGEGHSQKKVGASDPPVQWFERGPDRYSVTLVLGESKTVSLELGEAIKAAERLFVAVESAVEGS